MTGRVGPVWERAVGAAFRFKVAAIGVVAFALRATYTAATRGNDAPGGDAVYYYGQAMAVAHGRGFIDPLFYEIFHLRVQAAHHPPLYPVFLALASKVVGESYLSLRIASCALGALAVVVVGYAGRRVAGERAGIVAALCACFYPNIWTGDALLLSESLYALMIAFVIVGAYRLWDDPRPREAALLGMAIGFAALTRAEALMLVPLMAIPLVVMAKRVDRAQKVVLGLAVVALFGLTVSPWVLHNLHRFERPVTMSYGLGGLLPSTNCDETYYGRNLGYWSAKCDFVATLGPTGPECLEDRQACYDAFARQFRDESEIAEVGQQRGLDYIWDHRDRVPIVVAARVGRMWGLFRPAQQTQIDGLVEQRGGLLMARIDLILFYELVAVAVVGLVILRRRGRPIWPLLSMAILTTAVAALAVPVTRYRMPVELCLAILAGVVVDVILEWRRPRRRAGADGETSPDGDADDPSASVADPDELAVDAGTRG